ncbi:MAG: hypothetical protein DRO87_03655 [Candidatus Thorarchaeota archaeon]|nr:MAG: hypothetical protein DRO87_03655 [Candidatus Thorarchaeota archaeon]
MTLNGGPLIREMKAEDWPEFHSIDVEIFPDDMMERDWFMKWVERDGFYALEDGGQLVGMLIVAPFGDHDGHLGRIGVAKGHQGKGYGKALMQYAIEWFRRRRTRRVHLYTQDFNSTAQGLYRRFGFEPSGTTWHYFIPFSSLEPSHLCTCQKIGNDEIECVGAKCGEAMPASQIRRFLSNDRYVVLTLKDSSGAIVGACRFTPSFPGCFPFVVDGAGHFDDFIAGVERFALPGYDYVRVTFTDYPDIAEVCKERGYRLHHRLYKMTLDLG